MWDEATDKIFLAVIAYLYLQIATARTTWCVLCSFRRQSWPELLFSTQTLGSVLWFPVELCMLGNTIHESRILIAFHSFLFCISDAFRFGRNNIISVVHGEISLKIIGATMCKGCVILFRSLNKQKTKCIHCICSFCLLGTFHLPLRSQKDVYCSFVHIPWGVQKL